MIDIMNISEACISMLRRKIEKNIIDFFQSTDKKALLITGARQVGKTYIIESLGKKSFKSFIKIDFIENRVAASLFEKAENSKDLLLRLSALSNEKLIPKETLIFFDEVQVCKESISAIKYLVEEGSYKYILSGSLLGVELYNIKSMPVGYMDFIEMFPLDFEEFALANGVSESVIEYLQIAYNSKTMVDSVIHDRMLELFKLYLVVGGMPAPIMKYLETNNIRDVIDEQINIVAQYKVDITKYEKADKRLRITEVFNLIPSELNSKNKRFVLRDLDRYAKKDRYENTFEWLKNAGVAISVYNAEEPAVPLRLSRASTLFKLFLSDVGLLAAMYMDGIQLHILNGDKDINFGSVYENACAEELRSHGFADIYYFNSKKQGEVDFLVEINGEVLPIEIKSGKDYTKHVALNNILANGKYAIRKAHVYSNSNIKIDGKIEYYPIYMLMFLKKDNLPKSMVYRMDIDALKGCY